MLYRLIDDIYFNTGFKQVKNSYSEHKYKQAVISMTTGKISQSWHKNYQERNIQYQKNEKKYT